MKGGKYMYMFSKILVVDKQYGWQIIMGSAKKTSISQSKESGHITSYFLL